MCMGGGGGGSVITMPDTRAYDRMAQMQLDAMKAAQSRFTDAKQQQLNSALETQRAKLLELRDLEVRRAEDVSAQSQRLAALLGTPPPSESAKAPTVGRDRGTPTTQGKAALRIDRPVASGVSPGAGLNIT